MNKYIAIYLRLSLSDGENGESNSISNQRELIMNYIASSADFADMPLTEFIDDGYSGTNFDRPGVKQLLEAAREGKVCCVIVKDLSRFGRKYLEVCKYIEQIFPYLGIRFIAINDRCDSNSHRGTTAEVDIPVRNMINAMYSRDVSKKVKSAKQTQLRQGKCINAFALYGYKKDNDDKHKLVIDEPAAKVVRRIFELTCDGQKPTQIANILNADSILTPSEYKKNSRNFKVRSITGSIWTSGTVIRILRDEQYTGTLIAGKTKVSEVGSGKCVRNPKEDWIIVPGAYPEIVTQEMWNTAAEMKSKGSGAHGKANADRVLYKRVFCGYCRHVLEYKDDVYRCRTPGYSERYGCPREKYRAHEIVDIVKEAVKKQLSVMASMKKLCRDIKESSNKSTEPARETILRLEHEILQLQSSKRQQYEHFKGGEIDKAEYLKERETIETGICAKTAQREALIPVSDKQTNAVNSAHDFFTAFLKYQTDSEVSAKMINDLVDAVYVYSKDKIEIMFSFKDEFERASFS